MPKMVPYTYFGVNMVEGCTKKKRLKKLLCDITKEGSFSKRFLLKMIVPKSRFFFRAH